MRELSLRANVLAQAGRAKEPGQTAQRIPALPAANCWAPSKVDEEYGPRAYRDNENLHDCHCKVKRNACSG